MKYFKHLNEEGNVDGVLGMEDTDEDAILVLLHSKKFKEITEFEFRRLIQMGQPEIERIVF